MQTIYNDANNPSYPVPATINIQLPVSNIILTCSLQECIWRIMYSNSTIRIVNTTRYIINEVSLNDTGVYSLFRTTQTGINYTTAQIYIEVIPILPTTVSAGFNAVIVAIPVIVVLILVVVVIFLIITLTIYFMRRRKNRPLFTNVLKGKSKKTQGIDNFRQQYANMQSHSIPKKKSSGQGYANLSESIELTEYSEISPENQGAEIKYMTIDESTLIPNEGEEAALNIYSEASTNQYYSNLGKSDVKEDAINKTPPHVAIQESSDGNSKDMEGTTNSHYYTMMASPSDVTDNQPIVTTIIPVREYTQTYEKYIQSGTSEGSVLRNEFQQLKLECKEMSGMSVNEGTKTENESKNPNKNILPFDESRVVLNSQSPVFNYINASWLDLHFQFIATMHPTQATLRDFLQMIYQTEASMVVMLTTRREKSKITGGISNRVPYWPNSKGEELKCENFVCKLISSTQTNAFIKNEMQLQNSIDNKEHSFVQCISSVWNEDCTLIELNFGVSLLYRIIKHKQDFPSSPIIIHCEDGISKTGILMTVHNAIREMNVSKTINIFNTVKKLRRQRMRIVPTLACYTTCYSLLNEYCLVHL